MTVTSCSSPSDSFDCQFDQLNLEESQARAFEQRHVYEIYDKIAGEFSDSRYRAWPNVKKFVEELAPGTILVDLGTGNGKNLNLNKNIVSIGCDTSMNLLSICRKNQYECLAANVLQLPFKDESIDACIFIAVLHHLANERRRLDALRNVVRMLKSGGQCLVYVWAFEQELRGTKSSYIKQKYDWKLEDTRCVPVELGESNGSVEGVDQDCDSKQHSNENPNRNATRLMPIHYNGTKFKHQNCFVPWKKKNKEVPLEETDLRFYHLFKEGELDGLLRRLDGVQIVDSFHDNGNWAVKFRKI